MNTATFADNAAACTAAGTPIVPFRRSAAPGAAHASDAALRSLPARLAARYVAFLARHRQDRDLCAALADADERMLQDIGLKRIRGGRIARL